MSRLLAFSDRADKDRTIVVRWGKPHWFNLDCKWVFTSDSYWRLAKYFPCAAEREVGLCIWPGSGFTCPDIQRVEHRADSVWKRLAQKTSCRHLLLGQGLCGIMGHSQTCAGFFSPPSMSIYLAHPTEKGDVWSTMLFFGLWRASKWWQLLSRRWLTCYCHLIKLRKRCQHVQECL